MKLFVVQENDLREQNRLFVPGLSLAALVNFQKRDIAHLLEFRSAETDGHSHERIIPAGGPDRVQLVLDPLPSLVKISADLVKSIFHCPLLPSVPALVGILQELTDVFVVALLRVRSKDLIHLRHRKTAVLLCRRAQDYISHNVEGGIQSLRLVVPDISHLKAALQDIPHIKEAAVHRIQTGGLIMNVNISVLTGLKLIPVHKELAVQLLVQLIKDQATLGGHQSAVGVGIGLVPDITDRLALCVHVIHHMDEIQLVVPVITITLRHSRIDSLQGSFHNIVHLLDLDLAFSKGLGVLLCEPADEILLFLGEGIQNTGG